MSIRKTVGANYKSGQCEFSLWAPLAGEAYLEITGPETQRLKLNKGEYGYWNLNCQPYKCRYQVHVYYRHGRSAT